MTKEDNNKQNNIKKGRVLNNKKIKNFQKKKGKEEEKEINQKSIKVINNLSNKNENENISSKNKKNNSQIEKKNINDKNKLYKYAITSTNATNSSSIISKRKNQQTSSSVNKNSNDNKENKNLYNNNLNNKIILSKVGIANSNKNLYQKTSPNSGNFGLKKHFYKTNNNFKKNTLNKSGGKKTRVNEKKNIDARNNKKVKYKINKEIIKKKYIKSKHISQDFDSNVVCQMTENILNNKNNNIISSNNNSKNIINTEKNIHYKNFITKDNPNLITGDTKSNERNEKNFMEDKVIVNIRDIIKQEQEKNNEIENKKFFHTAQKSKNSKENLLKLTKTKANMQGTVKTLKLFKRKKKLLKHNR